MSKHTLISGIRGKNENNCNDLRTYEKPPEVKVFDLNGNLLRTEAPKDYSEYYKMRKKK